jgi:hypothetical protein
MNRPPLLAAAAAAACLAWSTQAFAHAVCGDRTFPATLVIDDPGVGDELSLPTVQYTSIPQSAGGGQTITYGAEWDKTITETFGIAINDDYVTQRSGGATLHGWDNLSVTLKDRVACLEQSEFMASVGVSRAFAKTGSASLVTAGVTDAVSNTAPIVYLGKGLGDLPIGYLRPLAVTGEISYSISDSPNASPNQWTYGATLQYSIPYLQQNVKALGLPAFISGMVPLVEFNMTTFDGGPSRGQTTGIVAPGILYEANAWQVGIEATIPANATTRQTQGTGVIVQFHLFLDDIFPNSIGKPIF